MWHAQQEIATQFLSLLFNDDDDDDVDGARTKTHLWFVYVCNSLMHNWFIVCAQQEDGDKKIVNESSEEWREEEGAFLHKKPLSWCQL